MKTMNAFVCKTNENVRKFYVYKNILKTCNAIDMLINLQFSLTSSQYYKFQRSVDTYLYTNTCTCTCTYNQKCIYMQNMVDANRHNIRDIGRYSTVCFIV